MWYKISPTFCDVIWFLSNELRLGDRKHTTRWIRITSHHKAYDILYMSLQSLSRTNALSNDGKLCVTLRTHSLNISLSEWREKQMYIWKAHRTEWLYLSTTGIFHVISEMLYSAKMYIFKMYKLQCHLLCIKGKMNLNA
jgi:hypothetical protein